MSKVTGVALGANQDGRLELVATTGEDEGESGDVWHAWQETPGGDWSGWHLLGPAGEIVFHGSPAVAGHADGRLHVAATGFDRRVWEIEQTAPDNGWSEWGVVRLADLKFGRPALARNSDGRLEVFAVADQGGWAVWHAWQATPGGQWSGWRSFGPPGSGASGMLTVGANDDGRLELFSSEEPNKGSAVFFEGHMFHRYQHTPGGGWSNWESLGTGVAGDVGFPVLGRNADGRLELFMGANGVVWHGWQRSPADSTSWSPWARLRHDTETFVDLAVGANADGRLVVVATNDRGKLWRREQNPGADGWQPWTPMPNVAPGMLQEPTLAANADGRLELFARTNPLGDLYQLVQEEPSGGWPSTGRRWRHP